MPVRKVGVRCWFYIKGSGYLFMPKKWFYAKKNSGHGAMVNMFRTKKGFGDEFHRTYSALVERKLDPEAAHNSLVVLAMVQTPKVSHALLQGARHYPDPSVRVSCIHALGIQYSTKAFFPLKKIFLSDPNPDIKLGAAIAMIRSGAGTGLAAARDEAIAAFGRSSDSRIKEAVGLLKRGHLQGTSYATSLDTFNPFAPGNPGN